MNLCSTRLGCLWLKAERSVPQQADGEWPDKQGVNSSRHDRFPNLWRVSSVCFHCAADGENGRPEWSVRRWVSASFLPCHSVDVLLDKFGGSSAAESPSVVGSVAVWESWAARETMVMSMSSLENTLEADPVIPMSLLRCVPLTRDSRRTGMHSSVPRAVPKACLACSCRAMVQGPLLRHTSSCYSWFGAPQCLQRLSYSHNLNCTAVCYIVTLSSFSLVVDPILPLRGTDSPALVPTSSPLAILPPYHSATLPLRPYHHATA
jgi:hypothetical protein